MEEEEIDLRDYLRVIKQRRKGIIAIFIIVVALTVIISLIVPSTYESKSLLKIGLLNKAPLESTISAKTILQQKDNLTLIAQQLDIFDQQEILDLTDRFDIDAIKDTDLFEIKGRGKTPTDSVNLTNLVKNKLLVHQQELFTEGKKSLELAITQIEQKIKENKNYISESENRLSNLQSDQTELKQKIAQLENTTSEAQARIASAYISSLNYIKGQSLSEQNNLKNLKNAALNLEKSLQDKQYDASYNTIMTQVINQPYLPQHRIAPKRAQNVIIGAILGLFIGIFWAFIAEYFSKDKNLQTDKRNENKEITE